MKDMSCRNHFSQKLSLPQLSILLSLDYSLVQSIVVSFISPFVPDLNIIEIFFLLADLVSFSSFTALIFCYSVSTW